MSSDHQITTLEPLYGQGGTYAATCICGWQSEPMPSAGMATIAAWAHVHTAPAEIPTDPKGT